MKLFFSVKPSVNTVYQKAAYVEWQTVEDKVVLIDNREMELFHLNEVGALVWDLMDGARTYEEIEENVASEFDAPLKQIQKDVSDFVKKLLERELIVKANA